LQTSNDNSKRNNRPMLQGTTAKISTDASFLEIFVIAYAGFVVVVKTEIVPNHRAPRRRRKSRPTIKHNTHPIEIYLWTWARAAAGRTGSVGYSTTWLGRGGSNVASVSVRGARERENRSNVCGDGCPLNAIEVGVWRRSDRRQMTTTMPAGRREAPENEQNCKII